MRESLCAVIVSYNGGAAVKECIEGIEGQAGHIIVVDNCSDKDTLDRLKLIEQKTTVEVIYNNSNLGIAKALNIGIKKALTAGYEWIITLDQDSIASAGMIDEMSRVYSLMADKQSVGILCPRIYDNNKEGFLIEDTLETDAYRELKVAIQSGSVVHRDIFQKIGYYYEPLFIYYVDVEFSMRVKNKKLKIYQCNNAILLHEEGKKRKRSLFGREYWYDDYNKAAVYYIARNSIYMIKAFKNNKKSYVRRLRLDFMRICVFDEKPLEKLKYYLSGVLDGLRNRYGKRDF